MRFSIIAVHVLFTFIQSAFIVSAIVPGYDCDNAFIPGERLKEILHAASKTRAKYEKRPTDKIRYKIAKWYDGPPFLQPYDLWPVSTTDKTYNEAEKTPYRVVIDEWSKFFSVVMKDPTGRYVKECNIRGERINSDHVPFDFDCSGRRIQNQDLRRAAEAACPKIGVFATQIFPARLPTRRMSKLQKKTLINHEGRHLYVFPVSFENREYKSRLNVETKFVVMDSACKVVSAIEETMQFEYFECRALSPSSS